MSWNKTVHSGLPSEIGDDFFYLHFLLLLPDELLLVEESGLEGRHLALFGHQLVVLHGDGLGHLLVLVVITVVQFRPDTKREENCETLMKTRYRREKMYLLNTILYT